MPRNPKWKILKPYPRQLEALKMVADGCSLTEGARRMEIDVRALASLLSTAYSRLKIKDLAPHHLSRDRRAAAIKICKEHGWWDGE